MQQYKPIKKKRKLDNQNNTDSQKENQTIKFLLSFIILFMLYHAAEYFIMFENNVTAFFIFQIAFFISAYVLGNWYSKNGLKTWGLPLSNKLYKPLLIGIGLGILLYGVTYLTSLALGIETVENIPDFATSIKTILPFVLGVFFTSFSEDVLTRGLVFTHLNTKIKPLFLILISATIYLLNHIYRLNDGIESLLYIFFLGILFILPVIYTKNLWLTGGMHWGGNVLFYFSHNIIQNQTTSAIISPNYLFTIWIVLFIPIVWLVLKRNSVTLKMVFKNADN